jgi:hypothetical protein
MNPACELSGELAGAEALLSRLMRARHGPRQHLFCALPPAGQQMLGKQWTSITWTLRLLLGITPRNLSQSPSRLGLGCALAITALLAPEAAHALPPIRLRCLADSQELRIVHLAGSSLPNLVGDYQGRAPAADAARRAFSLRLDADGTATLTTIYIGKGTVIQHAHWKQDGRQLVLTFNAVGSNQPPGPIVFLYRRRVLRPLHWNASEWGRAGPPALSRSRSSLAN